MVLKRYRTAKRIVYARGITNLLNNDFTGSRLTLAGDGNIEDHLGGIKS